MSYGLQPGIKRFSMQWKPNLMYDEHRLCLTRICWNRGVPGDGGCSYKVSVSICWKWQDLWVGMFIRPELWGFIAWICVIPCLPIRIHFKRAYGGSFV